MSKVTIEQLQKILEDNNTDIEELLDSIADWLEEDKKKQTHGLVIACLDAAIEQVKAASFNYYASWK